MYKSLALLPILLLPLLAGPVSEPASTNSPNDLFRTIRGNDLQLLRKLVKKPGTINSRDGVGITALHYAATYGSADAMKILLASGADVNARNNREATPLLYAAYDLQKTHMLVERRADVNARSRDGMTPLAVAASVQGNSATVKYLLDKGADAKTVATNGRAALVRAAEKGDAETVRLLLAHGADARLLDPTFGNALVAAFYHPHVNSAPLLINAGADVNASNPSFGRVKNGPITMVRLTPLMMAIPYADHSSVAQLLKAGTNVNATDGRGMSALMIAVASDWVTPDIVQELISAGADVNSVDVNGESALDWARKSNNLDILALLERAAARGKNPAPTPMPPPDFKGYSADEAIARASTLLADSGARFFTAGGGCAGCHHQVMDGRAYAAVHKATGHGEERLRRVLINAVVAERPGIVTNLPLMLIGGGDVDQLVQPAMALADLGEPASPVTDAIVQYLAAQQSPAGSWELLFARPPSEGSPISRTAMAVRTLKTYGWPARQREFNARIAKARNWLLNAQPVNNCEKADLIMGLRAAGASEADVRKVAKDLLHKQGDDGGWAQTQYLKSDAYATGMALYSLYDAGFLSKSDEAYRRGVALLLRTQFPDGSWYVRSRVVKLQPYFQTGFPFDHDQWISNAATAWAVMALAPAVGSNKTALVQ